MELKSDDAGIYYGRGLVRQESKNLDGALADYSKAVEIDPSLAQAYANRAVIETLQNKKPEAAKDFDKAFKLQPSLKAQYREFIEKRHLP